MLKPTVKQRYVMPWSDFVLRRLKQFTNVKLQQSKAWESGIIAESKQRIEDITYYILGWILLNK